jgi:NADPH2 dehydrogenase
MRMEDPVPQFSYLVSELAKRHPDLAYFHGIEGRVSGAEDADSIETLDFLRDIWRPTGRPFLSAGGYTPVSALEHVEKAGHENEMIVFGRHFIANVSLKHLVCS